MSNNNHSPQAHSSPPLPVLDPVLTSLLGSVRGNAVLHHFSSIDSQKYTNEQEIRIMVGTYNVHGKVAEVEDRLKNWLKFPDETWPRREDSINDLGPDIVALGFQEIVELNANNVIIGAGAEAPHYWDYFIDQELNGQRWVGVDAQDEAIIQAMNQKWLGIQTNSAEAKARHVKSPSLDAAIAGDSFENPSQIDDKSQPNYSGHTQYVRIACKQMVGIYLTIWAKTSMIPKIRGIETITVATGAFGYLGNKGSVAIRMRICDSSVLFLTCHLPSGQSSPDLMKRNVDFAEILRRCQFPYPEGDHLDEGQWKGITNILQHEHIIWFGDLNYRINMQDEDLRVALRAERYDRLLAKDELLIELDKGGIIHGFTEGIVTFPPTYKYRRRTNKYAGDDVKGEFSETEDEPEDNIQNQKKEKEKIRRPAWTDRILFNSKGGLHQLQYDCGDLDLSDHRPVYAAFLLLAKEYDRGLVAQSVELARKAKDATEMAAVPSCILDPSDGQLNFGTVRYSESVRKEIALINTGEVPAIFKFISVPGSDDVCPSWLQLTPHGSLLEPNTTHNIVLTARIIGGEGGAAQEVVEKNQGKLEAILVLRVEGGRDFFIAVSGQFQASFFGLSLDTVMQLSNQPSYENNSNLLDMPQTNLDILLLQQLDQILKNNPMNEREDVLQYVPIQIKQLTVYLSSKNRVDTPGLLVDSIQMCNMYDFIDGAETESFQRVRQALDDNQNLEQKIGSEEPHLIAAVLLLLFRALPRAFMPPAATQMCNVMVPAPQEAANLLAAEMTSVEWAVLRHMLNLVRKILSKREVNGISGKNMSQTLANIWFPPLADPLNDLSPQDGGVVGDTIQERLLINDNVAQTRSDFIQQFLFPQKRPGQ